MKTEILGASATNLYAPRSNISESHSPRSFYPKWDVEVTDEKGSATGEFVLIALPLFLPALLFFLAMSQIARSEMEMSFIAREAVRAFTTGSEDQSAHLRVQALLNEYGLPPFSYKVLCSAQPCISPGAKVALTVFHSVSEVGNYEQSISTSSRFWKFEDEGSNRTSKSNEQRRSIATAIGFVDKWQ